MEVEWGLWVWGVMEEMVGYSGSDAVYGGRSWSDIVVPYVSSLWMEWCGDYGSRLWL